jgi:hypothetical protein
MKIMPTPPPPNALGDHSVPHYNLRVEKGDPRVAQDLLIEMIIQGVDDYRSLRDMGMIRFGRPNNSVINKCKRMPRSMGADEVENVCRFIWGGWMAHLIEFAELKIQPIPIYQELEPKQWASLITKHQNPFATSH